MHFAFVVKIDFYRTLDNDDDENDVGVAGMVVAAGESLRMTSSGQPFACEDRARCPPAEEKAATESSRQRAFHQPTIHLPLSSSHLLTAST